MIYFAQAGEGGPIKIGFSRNPRSRLPVLRVGTAADMRVLAVMDGDRDEEMRLHTLFHSARIRGEWFHPSPGLMALIGKLPPFDMAAFVEPAPRPKSTPGAYKRRPIFEPVTSADLQSWRREFGWTQEQAAAWLCYSVRTYQKWEQAERLIPEQRTELVRRQMELAKARRRRA